MSDKDSFTNKILKESEGEDLEGIIVPEDDEIEEQFRCLDEVCVYFKEEKLLGVNTFRSVEQASKDAKKGIVKNKKGKSII